MSSLNESKEKCQCCTCTPCPKSISCCNKVSDTCFKEFVPLPKGLKKDDLKLDVQKNSYKICGRSTIHCGEDECIIHSVEFERRFKKPIKDAVIKEECGHPYVEGKFE
ncbi:hypothetical protein NCER_100148 [Vairimorpha ceranae BRL01]|uniref:Uncharacterized protein n=2 Tax=Vairimorpha ceranae TaxID=40302 RepID=C4V6V2_VAIC1|nr:hypothetical protein AAJ76_3300037939 [Vairimorpha ceranae]EEQ83060.1 hypothetical protein NCER_100148 [Vairimorpha ceranae BRL01]KAF5140239.1 hypothetical protein G9O61_00g016260 [Vairimorpha ceranae]KKO75091.1 hypothetical protein AAJ76_3300037939 [Vairimorpha ceranae]